MSAAAARAPLLDAQPLREVVQVGAVQPELARRRGPAAAVTLDGFEDLPALEPVDALAQRE